MHDAVVSTFVAALMFGVGTAGAQVTPPRPPAPPDPVNAPRPPRAPRAPRAWFGSSDQGVARIDTVVPFSPNGSIALSLVAGSIKLSTWDRNQVRVVASTSGEPSLQFDASNSHVTLEQVSPGRRGNRDRMGSATYDVTVPTGSTAALSAVSGSIDASGVRGPLEVNTVSGSVDVRDIGSSLTVEGVSGRITVTDVGKDARIENVSGRISVTGVGGSLTTETVSGSTKISGARGGRIHATSVSGDVDFTGAVNGSGLYEFETHSGRAELRLASNSSAAVSVETFSGSVSNDYSGAVRRRNSDSGDDQTNFDYMIGRGDGRVRVQTFSGSVHISQGNP
jgi:hypothetical protein